MNNSHQAVAQALRQELRGLAQTCRGILEGLSTLDQKWEAWELANQAQRESLEAQLMEMATEPLHGFMDKVIYLYELEALEDEDFDGEGDFGPEGDFDPDWRPAA
jgi:hypothetical protein